MAEKLRNKYSEVLKERDSAFHELKRVRHDYNYYVKQNDQVRTIFHFIQFKHEK